MVKKILSPKNTFATINNLKNWIKMNARIEIKEMPKMNLAYVTQIGVNGIDNAFQRIVKWASAKGLLSKTDTNVCRVFHDSFKVTDPDKVRMSIGILAKQELTADGEVGLITLEKGKNIVGHFVIEPLEFEKSWDSLFIWMNDNGYKKADRYPFEIYHNNFNEHPEKKMYYGSLHPNCVNKKKKKLPITAGIKQTC